VAVRVGQRATLQVDGLSAPLAATVARINPSAQGGTRAVTAYLAVAAQPGLRQGLFARGSIELDRRTALTIPAAALRTEQSRPTVLVVERGRAQPRAVQIGARGEVDFGNGREPALEVLSGLAEGEPVLRASVGSLPAGTAVQLPASASASASARAAVPASAPKP